MKQLLKFLTVLTLCATSLAASAVDMILPYSAGGSTTAVLQLILPNLKVVSSELDARYLGNCQMVRAQLTGRPQLYMWSNDLECTSSTVDASNFIALVNWNPLYLCGRRDKLDLYRTGDARLAVNAGAFYTQLGNSIRAAVNPNMRVVNYANTGAIKTALATGEVDISLSTNGPSLATEGLVKCYAVTTASTLNGLSTVKSIIGDVPGSVYSVTIWIASQGIAPADLKNIQNAVQQQMRTSAYRDLIVGKMKRELPDATLEQQIQRVNQSLQLTK